MKSVGASLLIGLFTAAGSYFLYDQLVSERETSWKVTYQIRMDRAAIKSARDEYVERITETINRRFSSQGFPSGVKKIDDTTLQVFCERIIDTSLARLLVTINPVIEFRKIYTLGDMPSIFLQIDNAINENQLRLNADLRRAWSEKQSIYSIMSPLIGDERGGQTIYFSAIGAILKKDTALFSKLVKWNEVSKGLPADLEFCFGSLFDELKILNNPNDLYVYATRINDNGPLLSNSDIRDIAVDPSVYDYNALEVFFTVEGLAKWKSLVAASNKQYVSVLVDGHAVSVPVASKMISGSSGIKLSISPDDAYSLKRKLAYGILPVDLEIVEADIHRRGWPQNRKKWALSLVSFALGFAAGILIFNVLRNNDTALTSGIETAANCI